MREPDDHDDRASGQRQHEVMQEVVDRLTRRHAGDDPVAVRSVLEHDLEAAGVHTSSEKWLGDAAVEIAAGRRLVVDGRQGLRDDPDDDAGTGAEPESLVRPPD
jgi:hypothetical protein